MKTHLPGVSRWLTSLTSRSLCVTFLKAHPTRGDPVNLDLAVQGQNTVDLKETTLKKKSRSLRRSKAESRSMTCRQRPQAYGVLFVPRSCMAVGNTVTNEDRLAGVRGGTRRKDPSVSSGGIPCPFPSTEALLGRHIKSSRTKHG